MGLRTLTILALVLASLEVPAEDGGRGDDPGWGRPVNRLQCRVVPHREAFMAGEPVCFWIQFRNAGKDELLLDVTRIYDLPLMFESLERVRVEYRFNAVAKRLDLRLPEKPVLVPLKPGETAIFTRSIIESDSWKSKRYHALYAPDGSQWRTFWSHGVTEMLEHSFWLRDSHKRPGRLTVGVTFESSPEENREADVWQGRLEARAEFGIVGRRYVPLQIGDSVAGLSIGLTSLEPRAMQGRPCRFRLMLRNGSIRPRLYMPVVNLLYAGGLRVTHESGQEVKCLNREARKTVPLRVLDGRGMVALCEFDLAAAYDLSRLGKYQIQFLATGGDRELEVVLPESNVAEVEVVQTLEEALDVPTRAPRKTSFPVRGTVKSQAGPVAPGATVILVEMARSDPRSPLVITLPPEGAQRKAGTDPEGHYVFEDVPTGRRYYWLMASHPEHGKAVRMARSSADAGPHDLTLTKATVSGVVLSRDGKTPFADAKVSLSRYKPDYVGFVMKTGEDGRFLFEGLSPAEYLLRVRFSEKKYHRQDVHLVVASQPSTHEIVDRFVPCKLTGRLLSPDGGPVANARLKMRLRDLPSSETRSDAVGKFTFEDLPEGDWELSVSKPRRSGGKAPRDHRVLDAHLCKEESPRHLEVKFPLALAKVYVKVLGPDGEPLRECELRRGRRTDAQAIVERKAWNDRTNSLVIIAPRLNQVGEVTVKPREDEREVQATVRLRQLQPCGAISGRVLEEGTGRPYGGLGIGVTPLAGDAPSLRPRSRPPRVVSRHGDGRFQIEAVPPGKYQLEIRTPEDRSDEYQPTGDHTTVALGKTTGGVEIRAPRRGHGQALTGRVLGTGDVPLVNQEVSISEQRAITDREGRFCLYPVRASDLKLYASLPGRAPGRALVYELKPARDNPPVDLSAVPVEAFCRSDAAPPVDPPGTWKTGTAGRRIRITPQAVQFPAGQPVIAKIEMHNTNRWPISYFINVLDGVFNIYGPDGKWIDNRFQGQQAGGHGPSGTIASAATVALVQPSKYAFEKPGKYRIGFRHSNVVELDVTPAEPGRQEATARPNDVWLEILKKLDVALPDGWAGSRPVSLGPRGNPPWGAFYVPLRYYKRLSEEEAVGTSPAECHYGLYVYSLSGQREDPFERQGLRLLGETGALRLYAAGKSTSRFHWDDPDGDIMKALKPR